MAFQTGSQVRPELGRADLSGFTRAGESIGAALASVGAQVGGAVKKYAVNKQKKEEEKLRYETILPYTTDQFGADEGDKMAKAFSKDPATAASILQFGELMKTLNEEPFEPTSREINGITYVETSEGNFAQPRAETDPQTVSMRNYNALIGQGVPPEKAREMAFGGKGGTNITVGGEGSLSDTIIRQTLNQDQQFFLDNVQPALNSIPNLQFMEKMLNVVGEEGEVITGRLGPQELFLKGVAKDLGFGEFKDVAATEAYLATAGRQVGQVIRLFGSGTGLSDADREYAEKIAGGSQKMTREALKKLVDMAKRGIEGQVNLYNSQINRTYSPDIVGEPVSKFALARLLTPTEGLLDYDTSVNAIDGTGASLVEPNDIDRAEAALNELGL